MSKPDLIIRGRRVVFPEHVGPASIYVHDGRIERVGEFDEISRDCEVVEVDDESIVMAGLVDTHVHINEPGRTEWEGFETATRAAAAGGVARSSICRSTRFQQLLPPPHSTKAERCAKQMSCRSWFLGRRDPRQHVRTCTNEARRRRWL